MKRRLLSLFLALTLLLSLCAPTAWALEPTSEQIKFVIDLTGYTGEITNSLQYTPSGSSSPTPISITPGQKNEFFVESGGAFANTKLYLATAPARWTVSVTGLADWNEYLVGATLYFNKNTSSSSNRIFRTSENFLQFFGRSIDKILGPGNWGSGGQTVVITPVFPTSQYSLTVGSSDENKGTVSATVVGTDIYELRATAGEGYSFDYWRSSAYDAYPDDPVYQIRENPYTTPAPTQDAHYTAYFRTWHKATVSASPAEAGTVSAERVRDDTWKLTASNNGATGYVFQCWNRDGYAQDDPVYRLTSPTAEVTLDGDAAYTAYYVPQQVTGVAITGAGWGSRGSAAGDLPIYAGTRVTVSVRIEDNSRVHLRNSHLAVYAGDQAAVEAGTAALLAQEDSGQFGLPSTISVAVWPQGVERITAVAWTDGCEKHYDTMAVKTASAGDALDLTWLSSPQAYRTSAGSATSHPAFFDVAAFVDRQTGQPAVYAAGIGGVFELDYGGKTDMVPMAGMEDLGSGGDNISVSSYALAVGGPDAGDLTALVKKVTTTGSGMDSTVTFSYELRRYDASQGAWAVVEGSRMADEALYPDLIGMNVYALVLDGDDVWTDKAHWDGAAWTAHGYSFTAFFKAKDGAAYAIARNADYTYSSYRYDGAAWTRLDGLPGALVSASSDGKLLVGLGTRRYDGAYPEGYAVVEDGKTTATYPAVSSSALGGYWTPDGCTVSDQILNAAIGFGGDGAVYAAVSADVSGTSSYLLRAGEDGWQLMDTVEAFDREGATDLYARPTSISRITAAAEGVTLFYGSDGALYLQTADFTITFHSNGGSEVAPVTGQAWSAVSVPRPTRDGYTFAGWYYDNDTFEKPWSETAIPASNLDLYAKWTKSGSVIDPDKDPYHEDRQKALAQLDEALNRMDRKDYSEDNWKTILLEYENGVYAIGVAKPKPVSDDIDDVNQAIYNTIYKALNAAINRMNAVPVQSVGNITVAVSVDADTIGLGYLVRPTLVTVPKYTRASVVLTDLLTANGYRWENTGTIENGFYLAQIKPVDQTDAKPADFLLELKDFTFNEDDKKDTKLGEFDYNSWSGWMYSTGDSDNDDYPSFPGVGASEYRMIDGEVMRWQFTCYGYGADLNADNSAWGTASVVPELGNKSELTWEVAALRKETKDAELEKDENFVKAIAVLEDPAATQSEIDAAYQALTGQGGGGSGGGGGSAITTQPSAPVNESGEAKVEMSAEDMAAIVERAKEDNAERIIIDPDVDGAPDKITVVLPKESVASIAKDTKAALVVKAGAADVTLPTAALADLAGRDGKTVSISAETLKDKSGKATGQVRVEVKSGDTVVEQLAGGVTVSLTVSDPTSGTVLMLITNEGAKIIKKSSLDGKTLTAKLDGSCTLMVKDNSKTFSDVPDNYWGKDAIAFVTARELFNGISDDQFAPAAPMTRAMLVTVLHRLEDTPAAKVDAAFPDVDAAAWYADAVAWASGNGIVTGTGSGFEPDGQITREQLATILYRYADFLGLDTSAAGALSQFSDGDKVSAWAEEAMQWAVGSGLLTGKGNGTVDPTGNATRAEVAAILQRMVAMMVK